MDLETIPLFDAPAREVLKPAKTLAQAERDQRPTWTSYSGKRVACDECVIFLHENQGKGPLPRSARRVRTVRATREQLRLCKDHADPREAADKALAEKAKAPAALRARR
jgi:hypothetical protein